MRSATATAAKAANGARLLAVLGPTNTGKTYYAIERMLGHRSGMIGFPLRLLARENYDRVVRAKGAGAAALITGEEKIVPPNPSYFLCTVESMPLDRKVAFLAVDEIQLAADPERGHVFTDRLLHARGEEETLLLGADTIRRLLKRLLPEAEIVSRPRLSSLSYAGVKKITRLPPRSAVVAFSAAGVYGLAELLRRRRGGTAVVLGALSPRTRNAQVAMYQAGEVDYMVATDAIGMGLNMDVRHVAFSALGKFDGRHARRLSAAELAQIAGRAGRHTQDGSFGTTGEVGPLDPELVEAVESHAFPPLHHLFWRNSDLDYGSAQALRRSLEAPPPARFLRRARDDDDHLALVALAAQPDVAASAAAGGEETVRLLWEVCQIPDFRKILSDHHTRLLGQVYRRLMTPERRLPTDWVARHVGRLDRTDGELDTLTGRIAHIRTWTYISHRQDWLEDPAHWQERARAIEDKLSDALHQRLTQRFVDRRAATLVRRLRDDEPLLAAVNRAGEVLVEGEYVGRLDGFRFQLDREADREDARALANAAMRALRGDMDARLRRLEGEDDRAFALTSDGRIAWRGAAVARLRPGPDVLRPGVEPLPSDLLEPPLRERLRRRLARWLQSHVRRRLGPLIRALECPELEGAARGLVYQLGEGLGALPRREVAAQIAALGRAERKSLARLGVRLGSVSVYLPALMTRPALALRAALWATHRDRPQPALPEGVAAPVDPRVPAEFYESCGYRVLGAAAVRADRLEKLAAEARRRARQGPFAATGTLSALVGGMSEALPEILAGLGYRAVSDAGGVTFVAAGRKANGAKQGNGKPAKKRRRRRAANGSGKPPRDRGERAADAASPFAKLRELTQR